MKITDVLKKLDAKSLNPISVVNMDLPDQPLIFVNTKFCEFTGFELNSIIGKNCRFLQGPKTDKLAIARIKDSINSGKALCQDLLNYKANSEIFYNRLVLVPFKENNQQHFLGLQHELDVTRFKDQHDIGEMEILDKTMNPMAILAGLMMHPGPDFEKNLQETLQRLKDYVLSL